jgi:hypothetical protein
MGSRLAGCVMQRLGSGERLVGVGGSQLFFELWLVGGYPLFGHAVFIGVGYVERCVRNGMIASKTLHIAAVG